MATTDREKIAHLMTITQQAPYTEFFQVVRLLARNSDNGYKICFKNSPRLAFPVSDVSSCQIDQSEKRITITTQFLGLLGQSGVMPLHYTEYLLERLQAKDKTLLEFLDIFHDQLLHLFYEVGSLSHFYQDLERGSSHPIKELLLALAGNYSNEIDELQLYFAGILQLPTRSINGLQQLLTYYFKLPIHIKTHQPKQIRLATHDVTHLSKHDQNNHLSRTALLGKKIWDVQSRFAVLIGPIDYQTFLTLLPGTPSLARLDQLIRVYTHNELEHDILITVDAQSLPACRLSRDKICKLAWNTRLSSKQHYKEPILVKFSANRLKKLSRQTS
ncbi:MAG: type VI secretion system baseplate subunit TssG [Gammaproteobacteria bacterium]|nr:type VI secretion system baseplate subunit TssG [Gammaproteobacteria bacterium]